MNISDHYIINVRARTNASACWFGTVPDAPVSVAKRLYTMRGYYFKNNEIRPVSMFVDDSRRGRDLSINFKNWKNQTASIMIGEGGNHKQVKL